MKNVDARDGDAELALFLEMRRRDREDQGVSHLPDPGPVDADSTSSEKSVPTTVSSAQRRRTAVEKFLDSENEKSDYEWLLASPEILCEKEPEKNSSVELKERNCQSVVLKPWLENIPEEPVSRSVKETRRASLAPGMYSMTSNNKRNVTNTEPKPSNTKPLKQAAITCRTAKPKPNITEATASISTKSAVRSSTPSRATKSSSLASAPRRSYSVGKTARGVAKSRDSKLCEMGGRSVSGSRGRGYSCGVKWGAGERSKGESKCSNDVNPVLMGTKMVERVVNMRKLAPPPKQNDRNSMGSGFGRTLSKSSLDMALRHMDIRRSMR